MIIGFARVSTDDQKFDSQTDALRLEVAKSRRLLT
jgi:DNA invertase Pin-like site-specific DNA recombinase